METQAKHRNSAYKQSFKQDSLLEDSNLESDNGLTESQSLGGNNLLTPQVAVSDQPMFFLTRGLDKCYPGAHGNNTFFIEKWNLNDIYKLKQRQI